METPGYLKELTDAVELIKMLEHITSNCSRQGNGQAEVPWSGMQITLSQSREIISRALAELCSEAVRESYNDAPQRDSKKRDDESSDSQSASLSERIQQAPSGQNRVRELLTNVSGSSSGRRGSQGSDEELVGNEKR